MRLDLELKDMHKLTVEDAAAAWQVQSSKMDYRHPAYPYNHQPQYNSNADKYLPRALELLLDIEASKPTLFCTTLHDQPMTLSMELLSILDREVEVLGNAARAAFLHCRHGYDLAKAFNLSSAELGLDKQLAKSANNVKEAVCRCIRFFRVWATTCGTEIIESKWPTTPEVLKNTKASVLMTRIKQEMIGKGVLDPAEATPAMVAAALKIYTDKAIDTADSRHWNSCLKALRSAVTDGLLPGVNERHLSRLNTIYPNPRKPAKTISEAEVIRRWPSHFLPLDDDHTHFDSHLGMPGFFNKNLGASILPNPRGEYCEPKNQLHTKAHTNRFRHMRRYLHRWLERVPESEHTNLSEAFKPQQIQLWLECEIKEAGKPLTSHRDGYNHALMIAKYYFGHEIGELVRYVKRMIRFPQDWESTRGEQALRTGTPQTLIEQADALGKFADTCRLLKNKKDYRDKAGAGRYLIRKAGQIDCWLRILTGLRPTALDSLEYSPVPDRTGSSPKIWKEGEGYYMLFIPLRWMKQYLSGICGGIQFSPNDDKTEVKGFEFEIWRPEAIKAIDDYIEFGWKHAKSVVQGRTKQFYLNSKGEPCSEGQFGQSFRTMKTEVYHFILKTEAREIQRHTRYQVRHIMSTYLEAHLPGFNLKKAYLTHSADLGTDKLYGKSNMKLLRTVIDEVLNGLPPRAEQEEEREQARDKKLEEMQAKIDRLNNLLAEAHKAKDMAA